MDPREYAFVKNGPDCLCHHARVDHVGWHERYEMTTWDVGCQVPGCEDCPPTGYYPLGPLNAQVLHAHDAVARIADEDAARASVRRLRRRIFVTLWSSLVASVLASVANNVMDRTVLAGVLAAVSVVLVGLYAQTSVALVRTMDPPRIVMTVAVLAPVPVLLLSTVGDFVVVPTIWTVVSLIAFVGTALVLLGLDHRRSMQRSKRSTQRMADDMAMMNRLWEPIATFTVQPGDKVTIEIESPDANEEPNGSAPRPSQ